MPELAEVEYYRRQWDAGLGKEIVAIALHGEKRIFRGTNIKLFHSLPGKKLVRSNAAGKQMLFVFSGNLWLGIHLGMSGTLRLEPAGFKPAAHDHLVLYQAKRALVFTDPRQFGRLLLEQSTEPPDWWTGMAPAIGSKEFSASFVSEFLDRHARLPVKAVLLLQDGFPGVGNWMADEILWRARVAPRRASGSLSPTERKDLWRESRFVSRVALKTIGSQIEDAPKGWLFHERWSSKGICPRHKTPLKRETIGGRTTSWCPKCQS